MNVRHAIDIPANLVYAGAASSAERDLCIKTANELGITFYNGRKPEEVFIYG